MPKPLSNVLTNAKVKSLQSKEKAFKVFDGNGLYLYITPNGTKSDFYPGESPKRA